MPVAHDAVLAAIEQVLATCQGAPQMPDLGGVATTREMGGVIADLI